MAEQSQDASARCFAGEEIDKRQEMMRARIEGVRCAEDVEAVHQMRVASRRLRAALSLFRDFLPRGQWKRWRNETRRITRALGDARDCDVQILAVEDFVASNSDQAAAPGMNRLLLRLRQRRRHQQPGVIQAVDRLASSGMLDEISHFSRRVTAQSRVERPDGPEYPDLSKHVERTIRRRVIDLLSYSTFVEMPDRSPEHHGMRIAAKRLRYSLEIFGPLLGKEAKTFVKTARKLQTHLGHLHDCDIWIERLDAFLKDERERFVEFYGHARGFRKIRIGIDLFAKDRRHARQDRYHEVVSAWRETEESRVWERLMLLVESPPKSGSNGSQNPPVEPAIDDRIQSNPVGLEE